MIWRLAALMLLSLSLSTRSLRSLLHRQCGPLAHRIVLFSSRETSATVSSLVRLEGLRLSQLKDLAKSMELKPGALRKAELVQMCHEQLLKRSVVAASPVETEMQVTSSEQEIEAEAPQALRYNKQRPRNLRPLPLTEMRHSKTLGKYNSSSSNNNNSTRGDDFWFNGENVTNKFPVGGKRDLRLSSEPETADMDLTFLGTASCVPSLSRGVSCIAFRTHSDMWLFDCGESSQLQLQKSRVKASKINKIFISHLHGDHSFGLPGVLCFVGQATQEEREQSRNPDGVATMEPIDIYGPEGLRDLIRSSIQLTYSRVVAPYRVHELKDVPYLHGRCVKWPPVSGVVRTRLDVHYGEQSGGRDIYPDEHGHYNIFTEGDLSVAAAPMQHTVPCVGFVITEAQRVGKLRVDVVQPLVDRQKEALKAMLQIKDANKVYSHLKQLRPGESFTFPDGTTLQSEEFLEPPRAGRKIVVMGDTCTGEHIEALAQGADVLIHEATNAHLPDIDARARTMTYSRLERDTFVHGHSTPQMAGKFASRIKAKRLVLTHFSPRYRGEPDDLSMRIMWKIEDQARTSAGGALEGKNDIIAGVFLISSPLLSILLSSSHTNTISLSLSALFFSFSLCSVGHDVSSHRTVAPPSIEIAICTVFHYFNNAK